jgi:hypothetical protein
MTSLIRFISVVETKNSFSGLFEKFFNRVNLALLDDFPTNKCNSQ